MFASAPAVRLFKAAVKRWKVEREAWTDLRQDYLLTARGHFCHPRMWMGCFSPCGKNTYRRKNVDGMQHLIGVEMTFIAPKGSWEM